MAWKPGKDIILWVPPLAFLYAFYEYYADRGFDGIMKDLSAITLDGIRAKIHIIIGGMILIVGAETLAMIVVKYVKNPTLKLLLPAAVRSIGYYAGAKQLATALRQGAGYRGGAGGGRLPPAGLRQAANPYMR